MKKDKAFGQLNYKNHAVMRYYYEQNKFGTSLHCLHLHILHDIIMTSLISLFSLFSSLMMMIDDDETFILCFYSNKDIQGSILVHFGIFKTNKLRFV
jgi:hypothetical protein